MLRIGLLSDTHGYLDSQIFTYFRDCDELWHAGDLGTEDILTSLSSFKPTLAVYGNVDGGVLRQQLAEDEWFEREGLTVWMTHIGGYPPRYNPRTRQRLAEQRPDLFICGHSHILKVVKDPNRENMLCLNPGAAGRQGFHRIRTILRFTLKNAEVTQLEAIELGAK